MTLEDPAWPRANDTAFAAAYAHRGAVLEAARRVCGNPLAEDVTQNVYLALWRSPGRFDPARGSLRTFLMTMGHNMAVDQVRSGDARRRRDDRVAQMGPVAAEGADARVERSEVAANVLAAVERLPAKEREAILMAFYGGRTYREVARALDTPEGTIKSRIRLGLSRLHMALQGAELSLG